MKELFFTLFLWSISQILYTSQVNNCSVTILNKKLIFLFILKFKNELKSEVLKFKIE